MTENVRNLANLIQSSSSTRVLNLLRVHAEHGHTEEWAAAPMFRSTTLNRALFLKHRLRRDEVERFRFRRHRATKIMLATDMEDLRSGGRSIFIGETSFDQSLAQAFGVGPGHPDRRTLAVIDALPSFDPFLLREQLRRNGISPAPCYFNLSEAELAAMANFVSGEIAPLIDLSLGPDSDLAAYNPLAVLTGKILSSSAQEDLSALGATLMLQPEQYREGIFCWKGFLYYKWTLRSLLAEVRTVSQAIRRVEPLGGATPQQYVEVNGLRATLPQRLLAASEAASRIMGVYDAAFRELTQEGRPKAFRVFMRESPILFPKLGERLGTLQHIVSFWNYRIGPRKPPPPIEELIDILRDFEDSLLRCEEDAGRRAA